MPNKNTPASDGNRLVQASSTLQSINDEERTIECVFSTGMLVKHYLLHNGTWQFMQTRLVLTPEACDTSQAEKGVLPVLDQHGVWNTKNVLGNVQEITFANNEARAVLKFSQADSVQDTWQKVADGSLRQVSVGFDIIERELRIEQNASGEDFEVMYFTKWRPVEISMVVMGADEGAFTQSALISTADTPVHPPNSTAQAVEPARQPPAADRALSLSQQEADVFDLNKTGSQAWADIGAKIYWDDTNKRCTTGASGNKLIGVALEVVGATASETVGQVRLGIVD
ncbi:MAG: capsid cement protein [Sulfitobacter sp.]